MNHSASMLSECKSSLLSIFQVTATNETNTNITIYILTIALLVRNQITQTSQSLFPRLAQPRQRSERSLKLSNQNHE